MEKRKKIELHWSFFPILVDALSIFTSPSPQLGRVNKSAKSNLISEKYIAVVLLLFFNGEKVVVKEPVVTACIFLKISISFSGFFCVSVTFKIQLEFSGNG